MISGDSRAPFWGCYIHTYIYIYIYIHMISDTTIEYLWTIPKCFHMFNIIFARFQFAKLAKITVDLKKNTRRPVDQIVLRVRHSLLHGCGGKGEAATSSATDPSARIGQLQCGGSGQGEQKTPGNKKIGCFVGKNWQRHGLFGCFLGNLWFVFVEFLLDLKSWWTCWQESWQKYNTQIIRHQV